MAIYFACFDIWKSYVNTLPDNWFKSILALSTHQYALMVDGLLKIFEYAIRSIVSIIDDPKSASEKLKNNLLHSDKVNRDAKIDLLIAMIPNLSGDYIKEILTLLNLTDYLKIFDTRSRPKLEINDENEKLLTAFKEANMINNYEESPEKEGYYKITRPKPVIKALPKELL